MKFVLREQNEIRFHYKFDFIFLVVKAKKDIRVKRVLFNQFKGMNML